MIGYKQVEELTFEECYLLLEDDSNSESPFHKEIDTRFRTLEQELSLKDCYDFLEKYRYGSDAYFLGETLAENSGVMYGYYYQEVHCRYLELVEEMKVREEHDFESCSIVEDYEAFIQKYSLMAPAYSACCIEKAMGAIEKLKRLAQQREEERREEARRLKEEKWRKIKQLFLIVAVSLVVLAVVAFFVGYRPVKTLSVSDVSFGKEGGQQSIRIETNVLASAIDVISPSEEWIQVASDGLMLNIVAEPNPDPERSCTMEVEAYTTFYGTRFGTPMNQKVIIRQGSGYATHIQSERALRFSQYGDSKIVNVKTDGVKLQLSSPQSWIHIIPKEQRHDGRYYHDDDFVVTVDANPNESQTGTILVESGGKSSEIPVSQASGYASELVSPAQLSFGKFAEKQQIAVKTDGVSLQLTPSVDWITCRRIRHDSNQKYYNDDQFEISVSTNYSGDKSGKILVQTGGKASEITVSQKSGLANRFKIYWSSINIQLPIRGTGTTNYVDIRGTGYGDCLKVKVDTDGTTWSVRSNRGWIGTSKVGNTVEITVENNEGGSVRDGRVYITSNNGHEETVDVYQDGYPTTFYPEYSRWTFDTDSDYKYITINNNSHQPVSVSSSDERWLSAYMSGSSVRISCKSNSGSPKDGTVTLTCGNKKTEISIHQKGWKDCTSCINGYNRCSNNGKSWGNCWGLTPDCYSYQYINGVHTLVHAYVAWGRFIEDPSICNACGGTGWEKCGKCNGKGKIKIY